MKPLPQSHNEHFHPKVSSYILTIFPSLSLLSVMIEEFSFSRNLCEDNHILGISFCLTYFDKHNYTQTHPCHMGQQPVLLILGILCKNVVFCWIGIPQLVYLFTFWSLLLNYVSIVSLLLNSIRKNITHFIITVDISTNIPGVAWFTTVGFKCRYNSNCVYWSLA